MSDFVLDERLAADTAFVADWQLCSVRLMEDARYPWLVLVPRRDATEIFHLSAPDRAFLVEEIARAGRIVAAMPGVDKLNVGALGNLVSQLHIHVVGRRPGDPAWPGPVWGQGTLEPYESARRAALVALVSGS